MVVIAATLSGIYFVLFLLGIVVYGCDLCLLLVLGGAIPVCIFVGGFVFLNLYICFFYMFDLKFHNLYGVLITCRNCVCFYVCPTFYVLSGF